MEELAIDAAELPGDVRKRSARLGAVGAKSPPTGCKMALELEVSKGRGSSQGAELEARERQPWDVPWKVQLVSLRSSQWQPTATSTARRVLILGHP